MNDIRWWIEGRRSDGTKKKRLWGEIHGLDEDYDSDDTEYDLLKYPDENLVEMHWIPRTVDNNKNDSHAINCTASD